MSHDEIEACVLSAKAGNQEDLLKVIEQYKPFIYKMISQFNIKGCELNDLLQIGCMAVINAVAKYKTDSHTFSTYAFNSIKNAFKHAARQNARFGEALSLNIPVDSENNLHSEFIDCIEEEEKLEESLLNSEELKMLRTAVAKLSEEDMGLIIMIYYLGASLKAYAEHKQLDYFEAFKRRNNILKKLKFFSAFS